VDYLNHATGTVMPNIVERLREIGPRMGSPGEIFPEDFATIAEGAAEIERLEHALAAVRSAIRRDDLGQELPDDGAGKHGD
jgi:hypothetical protein